MRTRWVETRTLFLDYRARILLFLADAWFVGWGLFLAYFLSGAPAHVVIGVGAAVVGPALTTGFVLYARLTILRRVGVSDQGVVLQYVGREYKVPWSSIRLPTLRVHRNGGRFFEFSWTDANGRARCFVPDPVTVRLILTHPNQPGWEVPDEFIQVIDSNVKAPSPRLRVYFEEG